MNKKTETKDTVLKAMTHLPSTGTIPTVDGGLLILLSKAAKASGIDFNKLLHDLRYESALGKGEHDYFEDTLYLSDYFLILHKLSNLTQDEVMKMSNRPLMQGAFHFVLTQAYKTSTFEESLRMFAKSFNLLHGATYNHVYMHENIIVYKIDNNNFPYPFEVTVNQSHSIMECIMILMHLLFVICNGSFVDNLLVKTTTMRTFSRNTPAPHQLAFWKVPVTPKSKSFALVYDLSTVCQSPIDKSCNFPPENAIFSKVAEMIIQRCMTSPTRTTISFKQIVYEHLITKNSDEDDVSEKLHISKRTLRRRLKEANTTFNDLKRSSLNSRSKMMLKQDLLIEEITENLGYSDERSFRRAFSRWNKMTPKQYRSQLKNDNN